MYGTCIGAVNRFGAEEKSLIGLSGIFIGIGEILGKFALNTMWYKIIFAHNYIMSVFLHVAQGT